MVKHFHMLPPISRAKKKITPQCYCNSWFRALDHHKRLGRQHNVELQKNLHPNPADTWVAQEHVGTAELNNVTFLTDYQTSLLSCLLSYLCTLHCASPSDNHTLTVLSTVWLGLYASQFTLNVLFLTLIVSRWWRLSHSGTSKEKKPFLTSFSILFLFGEREQSLLVPCVFAICVCVSETSKKRKTNQIREISHSVKQGCLFLPICMPYSFFVHVRVHSWKKALLVLFFLFVFC